MFYRSRPIRYDVDDGFFVVVSSFLSLFENLSIFVFFDGNWYMYTLQRKYMSMKTQKKTFHQRIIFWISDMATYFIFSLFSFSVRILIMLCVISQYFEKLVLFFVVVVVSLFQKCMCAHCQFSDSYSCLKIQNMRETT